MSDGVVPGGRRAFAARLSVGLVDQMLSSGTNFVATVGAARLLGPRHFGAFSLVMVAYLFSLGINRGLTNEAMLVRPGDGRPDQLARAGRAGASALSFGALVSLLCLAAAVVLPGERAGAALLLAVVLPGLLLQDALRYASFSRDQPKAALVSDGVWMAGQLVAFGLLSAGAVRPTLVVIVACWAVPGVLGGMVQLVRDRVRIPLAAGASWISANRDLSVRYALDFLSIQGAGQLSAFALAGISGVGAVGSLRGAQTLFGPLSVLLTGTYIVLVPEGRRAVERSTRQLTVLCASAALGFFVAALGILAILLLLRPSQGSAVLGSTWETARPLLVPIALGNALGGLYAGATAGLRAMEAASALLRVRLRSMPTAVVFPLVGAVLADAGGMAYGILAAEMVAIVWYVAAYRREVRGYVPRALRVGAPVSG